MRRVKLVAEFQAGVTTEVEVGRLERDERASVDRGSCSSPPFDLKYLALRVRRLDVTLALGIQGWDDRTS